MTPGDHRRQAAALAAYLAQFDLSPAHSDNAPTYADLPASERAQRHNDQLRAIEWAQADALTEEEVQTLRELRWLYGFP
ncbi:hypothetical protein [Rhodococcus globerulus]|uniref:hypothetical protein n=1 Tax=Rhodococcus globerulus TaxID=33008 RepID=UPI0030190F63